MNSTFHRVLVSDDYVPGAQRLTRSCVANLRHLV